MRQPTVYIGMTPTLRLRIETTIENLVALLDEIDGEPDLEDGADGEPYLAGTAGSTDDRENDGDDLEPDVLGERMNWTNDPNMPQEGERWHGSLIG